MIPTTEECFVAVLTPQFFGGETGKFLKLVRNGPASMCMRLTVDCSDTKIIDSSGIGALIAATKDMRRRGGELILTGLNDNLRALFRRNGCDCVFTIADEDEIAEPVEHKWEPENSEDIGLCISRQWIGPVLVLRLAGMLIFPHCDTYFKREAIKAISETKHVLVELSNLSLYDKRAFATLVRLNRIFKAIGGHFALCAPNHIVVHALATYKETSKIEVFGSVGQAIEVWQEEVRNWKLKI